MSAYNLQLNGNILTVSTLVSTAGEITATFNPGNPGTWTFTLPLAIACPGTLTSGGFADGSSAAAGNIGEYYDSGALPAGSALTTATPLNAPLSTFGTGSGAPFLVTAGNWEFD